MVTAAGLLVLTLMISTTVDCQRTVRIGSYNPTEPAEMNPINLAVTISQMEIAFVDYPTIQAIQAIQLPPSELIAEILQGYSVFSGGFYRHSKVQLKQEEQYRNLLRIFQFLTTSEPRNKLTVITPIVGQTDLHFITGALGIMNLATNQIYNQNEYRHIVVAITGNLPITDEVFNHHGLFGNENAMLLRANTAHSTDQQVSMNSFWSDSFVVIGMKNKSWLKAAMEFINFWSTLGRREVPHQRIPIILKIDDLTLTAPQLDPLASAHHHYHPAQSSTTALAHPPPTTRNEADVYTNGIQSMEANPTAYQHDEGAAPPRSPNPYLDPQYNEGAARRRQRRTTQEEYRRMDTNPLALTLRL